MYALRIAKYGKMFIRNDGLCTDNKAAAKLFQSIEDAKVYVHYWRKSSGVNEKESLPLNIVEVKTKVVIQKVGDIVETV